MPTYRSPPTAVLLFTLLIYLYPIVESYAAQTHSSAWIQHTQKGLEFRAIFPIDNLQGHQVCPNVYIDNQPSKMQVRALATQDYPTLVCEITLPISARHIRLNEQVFSINSEPLKRIILLGDTGCKVADNENIYQFCNNPSLWPFHQISTKIASLNPDLIIHTGDYIYRESPCPKGNYGCENTPFGHNQATWNADWFTPATPMLQTAPFIFSRGNHETCQRAGKGWFRYLAPRRHVNKCIENTSPWFTHSTSLQFAILDTASIKDTQGNALTSLYRGQIHEINTYSNHQPNKPAWIISHRPFWSYGNNLSDHLGKSKTKILQKAIKKSPLSASIEAIISGHIHFAQVIDFEGMRPTQIIAGNGGSDLANPAKMPTKIDHLAIQSQKVRYQYGFIVMDKTKQNHWRISLRDVAGDELLHCTMIHKTLFC
ncbi:metallophosphoesterase [uncultured Shewanella sp.]|uniref:metallophosphoesterase family protein n=1 Tax=uncultured Shewanella sp. TaxID=173975 RepID=UPI00262365C2|nr:metallophosphoesterase [uncultured Shewanella sp.]